MKLKDEASDKIHELRELFKEYGGTVGVVLAAVGAATVAAGYAIVELAEKGSQINEVTDGFDRLAGGVENADEILASMTDGVKNTIDKFSLMANANKLLQSGIEADADNFSTLTKAALVLSNEGFGGTAEMMDMLSTALERGASRQGVLKAAVGDLDAAEKEMQRTLGQTAPLDRANKLIADRQGLLVYMKRLVEQAGEQELTFGKQLEQAKVAFTNWMGELEKAVAKSPELQRAFDAIKDALTKAFGGDGQVLIDDIVAGVGYFANAVADAVPYVVSFAGAVKDVWNFLIDHQALIMDVVKVVGSFAAAWGIWEVGGALVIGIVSGFTAVTRGITALTVAISANPLGVLAIAAVAAGTAISHYANSTADAAVKAQVMGAQQDVMNKAIAAGDAALKGLAPSAHNAALAAQFLAEQHKEVKKHVEATVPPIKLLEMTLAELAAFTADSLKTAEQLWGEYAAIVEKDLATTAYAQAKIAIQDWMRVQMEALEAWVLAEKQKYPGNTQMIIQEYEARLAAYKSIEQAKLDQLDKDTARADATSKAYYDRQAQIARDTYAEYNAMQDKHSQNEIEAARRAADALTAAADAWQPYQAAGTSAADALKSSLDAVAGAAVGAASAVGEGAKSAASAAGAAIDTVTKSVLSWSEAMDLVRKGQGTMTGTIQNGPKTPESRAAIQKAWNEGNYYGPVIGGNQGNPRGSGPDFKALGYEKGGPTKEGPAYLHDDEFVVPKGGALVKGGGGGTMIVQLVMADGRELARAAVPWIPGELRRIGVA